MNQRIIKFRAWDKVFSRMLDRPFVIDQDGRVYFHYDGGGKVKDMLILMQFTGLKDKKNVEIFEGDIVKHDLWGEFKIIWDDISAGFRAVSKDGDKDINMGHAQLPRIKVVGNIYENPDKLDPSYPSFH